VDVKELRWSQEVEFRRWRHSDNHAASAPVSRVPVDDYEVSSGLNDKFLSIGPASLETDHLLQTQVVGHQSCRLQASENKHMGASHGSP